MGLGLLAWPAPPVEAAVTSANPANGFGELYPYFTTDDALFAYVTTDTRGGRVCVIPASGVGNCDAPASGTTANTIIGIGTLFTLLEGPDLPVGNWRLLTENPTPSGWERGYLSDVFTVGPCQVDCDLQIGRRQAEEFKRLSGATRDAAAVGCVGFSAATNTGVVRVAPDPPGDRDPSWAGAVIALRFTPTAVFMELFTAATGMDIARKMLCEVRQMYDDIANDPPDPTLYEVAMPQFTELPTSDSPLLDGVAAALDRQAAHGIAARISYERYQGAVEVGDLAAQRLQAAATATQSLALVDELHSSVRIFREAAAAVPSDPELSSFVVTEEQREAVVALATRVRAEGFSPDERQQLLDLGLTPTEIGHVESWMDLPYEELVPGQTIAGLFDRLADAFEAAIGPIGAFARNALAIANTDLAPSTAGISPQLLAKDTWRFTATGASPDGDPVEHEWDFGDGATATGEVVEHTFAASGTYTVRVTTRETSPWGSSATATQPVTVVLNNPPTANQDQLSVAAGTSATIDVLANDMDIDGDTIEVVSIAPATGGTASCQPSGICTYTALPGIVGTESLPYVISDGAATATGTLVVEIVPASNIVVSDVSVTTPRGATVRLRLPVSDPEPGPLPFMVAEVVDPPSVVSASPAFPESLQISVPGDADPGTDSFTYRMYDGAQRSGTATVTVTILATNQAPTAADIAVSVPAGVPTAILLVGEDPDGTTPLTYHVDSLPSVGALSGTAPDLVFDPQAAAPGTVVSFAYRVNDGITFSEPATVTVTVGPPPGGPIVDLGDDLTLDEGLITFSATTHDPEGGSLAHLWDFGDGRTSTASNPSLVFDDGVYLVSLTVTDSLGRTSSDSLTMRVRNRPPNLFGIGFSGPIRATGIPVSIQAQATDPAGDPLEYRFELGDGTVVTTLNATVEHTYSTPGDKVVRVTVTDDDGASSTRTVTFDVIEPYADAGPDQVVPEGSYVEFSGTGFFPSPPANYRWDFDDDEYERRGTTAVHRWSGDEPRTATLTITYGPFEATDTVTVTFTNLPPKLGPAIPLVAEAGAMIDLLAGAFDPGGDPVTVTWDLGDGSAASGEHVRHAYAEPGDYTIRITAVDDEGASAEAVASITIVPPGTLGPATVDSRGRSFHLAFDRNQDKALAEQYLMITGEQNTTGTVSVPGLGFRATFAIAAGRVSIVRLPDDVVPSSEGWGFLPWPPAAVDRHAVIIHAREEVTVYGVNRQPFSTDAFLALPDDIAGTELRVMSYGWQGAQADIVAIHPDTTVTITDGFTTVEETIQPGDVLRVNDRNPAFVELAGARVSANHPVHVMSGHICTEVANRFCDHLVESVWSEALMGRRFLTVPLATRAADVFRIVASRDGTEVRIDGVLTATLAAGRHHDVELSTATEIVTSEPALVAQLSKGGTADSTDADPFMMLIPPEEQWLDRYTVATLAGISRNYLNLVVRDGGQSTVQVDGAAVDPALWAPIGASGYVGAQLPVGAGEHRIVSARPVSVSAYGFDVFDSYGYPGGMALAPVAAVASIDLSPAAGERALGSTDCPVATVTDASGAPLAGIRLDLTVTGANPAAISRFSRANGTAELCFAGTTAGEDSLVVRNGVTEARATRMWTEESQPPNQPPTASNVFATTDQDVPVEIVLVGADPDGDDITFAIVTNPSNGTLGTLVGDRVVYSPAAGFAGSDSFTYVASDGSLTSSGATVSITVNKDPDTEPPDTDPPETTITSGPDDPTTETSAMFEFVSDEDGSTFTCVLDDGDPEPCDAGSAVYGPLALGMHTFSVAATDPAGNTDPTPATYTWEIVRPPTYETTLAYTGAEVVALGSPFAPRALLTAIGGSCPSGQVVQFSLDDDPTTAQPEDGPFELGIGVTSDGGVAQAPAVSTATWLEGAYSLRADFAGTGACHGSSAEATLVVTTPSAAASGGGFYHLTGSGRVSFGFTVQPVDGGEATGQLVLINTGKWRLKGTLDSYVRTGPGAGSARGSGRLSWWDAGTKRWETVEDSVTFTISFLDSGSGRRSADTFGIQIDHVVSSPGHPQLPTSAPQPLRGGNVTAK